jgi:hypothetical protein
MENEVKPRLRGKVFEIRYADDAVLCFQYLEDAQKVLRVLPKRFAKFGLTLHPEKTRLVEFGRKALAKAERAGTKLNPGLSISWGLHTNARAAGEGSSRCKSRR